MVAGRSARRCGDRDDRCGRRRALVPPARRHHRQPAHEPDLDSLRPAIRDERVRLVCVPELLQPVERMREGSDLRGLRVLRWAVQRRPDVHCDLRAEPPERHACRVGAERVHRHVVREPVRPAVRRPGGLPHRPGRGRRMPGVSGNERQQHRVPGEHRMRAIHRLRRREPLLRGGQRPARLCLRVRKRVQPRRWPRARPPGRGDLHLRVRAETREAITTHERAG